MAMPGLSDHRYRPMKSVLRLLIAARGLAVVGVAVVAGGVWTIHPAAGLIAAGVGLVLIALALAEIAGE